MLPTLTVALLLLPAVYSIPYLPLPKNTDDQWVGPEYEYESNYAMEPPNGPVQPTLDELKRFLKSACGQSAPKICGDGTTWDNKQGCVSLGMGHQNHGVGFLVANLDGGIP